MPASVGLRDRRANKRDKNLFPHGDYLLPMGKRVKMVLMLAEKNSGKEENTVGKGRETSIAVCNF